jgi:RHS repeat-associated protein
VSADYDSQDRLVHQDGVTYQFNADGQLTQRGTDTFQYSATGELLQATVPNQSTTPITYAYDGMNRRIAKTDDTGTYQYLYGNLKKPFQLTAMRDTAGVLSTFYYDEAGALFAMDKGSARYYVASDQVGSPRVVSDAAGVVVKYLEYDSFGLQTYDSNPAVQMPVGFAGGITDDKTGLVRFGYRDYDPDTGRWTAKDPIFFGGGQGNLYQYVQNNPINFVDPSGLKFSDMCKIALDKLEKLDTVKTLKEIYDLYVQEPIVNPSYDQMMKAINTITDAATAVFKAIPGIDLIPGLKMDTKANDNGLLPEAMRAKFRNISTLNSIE